MDKLGIYAVGDRIRLQRALQKLAVKSANREPIGGEVRKEDSRRQSSMDSSVNEELEHVQIPLGSLSVSSEHEFVHNDQTSLLDDGEEGGYGSSYPSEVDLSSPSFDLQRSSQYSSTINSIVLHYKSHGGTTPTSRQDSDSIHSSNYTKSVNSQGGMKELLVKNRVKSNYCCE